VEICNFWSSEGGVWRTSSHLKKEGTDGPGFGDPMWTITPHDIPPPKAPLYNMIHKVFDLRKFNNICD
jgi:hypothetical protein